MKMLSLVIAILIAAPLQSFAEARVSFSETGRTLFSFEVPDFWTLKAGGERQLSLPEGGEPRGVPQILSMHPTVDPTVWMAFYAPPGVTTLAEGREYLSEIGQFIANAPQVVEEQSRAIAGRPSQVIRGTGTARGKDVQFTVTLIGLPGPRIAIGAVVIEEGAPEGVYEAVNDVFSSFKAGG
ncbi:MAG: hypothetical protein AAGF71_10890 [Pseudomonadota bacterium]